MAASRRHHHLPALQALFVTFLWSTSWVLIKFGLQDIPAISFAGLRYALAFLLLAMGLAGPDPALAENDNPLEKVARVIEGLSAMDQEILALRHFEELTNSEAAAKLGLTKVAASKRYIRAIRRLKEAALPELEAGGWS